MKFNLYSLWIDPVFYVSAAVFVLFLFLLIYSMRRYMEVSNASEDEEMEIDGSEQKAERGEREPVMENPVDRSISSEVSQERPEMEIPVEEAFEKTVIAQASEIPTDAAAGSEHPENIAESKSASKDFSEAEGFVKGIFNGISDIDERLKAVESTLSERKLNGDFALRYLEDILDEYEVMDKPAVKARIEYLIADLKK